MAFLSTTLRLALAGLALATLGACSGAQVSRMAAPDPVPEISLHRSTMAVQEARAKRARGERVWCVPFARTLSGIDIRGNAETWWSGAKGTYDRGHQPEVGAVMVFSGTRKLPMGHVAVVSRIVSDREILVDHANWKRNQVSLGMSVVDVSKAGDWSAVQVAYNPGRYGSNYSVAGFIYQRKVDGTQMAALETPAPAAPGLDAALTGAVLTVSTMGGN